MNERALSIAELNTIIAEGKLKIWVWAESVSTAQAMAFLHSGASLVKKKTNLMDIAPYLKIAPSEIILQATGYAYNELESFTRKNVNILFNRRWDEAELASLLIKGKNKLIINGKDFSKEELLVFAGKGAQVILNNRLELPDINSFLSLPNKNILIRGEGFTQAELHSFLRKGAQIIFSPGTPEDEIIPLFTIGKDKIIMASSNDIWK